MTKAKSATVDNTEDDLPDPSELDVAPAADTALVAEETVDAPAVPVVGYGLVSDVTSDSATLTGSVSAEGSDAWFVYKGDHESDYSATPSTTGTEVIAKLSNLKPGSRYTYVLVVRNSAGTGGGGLHQDFVTEDK